MLSQQDRHCGLGGSSRHRMLLEHERYDDLGMDARVTVHTCNANALLVWTWML